MDTFRYLGVEILLRVRELISRSMEVRKCGGVLIRVYRGIIGML